MKITNDAPQSFKKIYPSITKDAKVKDNMGVRKDVQNLFWGQVQHTEKFLKTTKTRFWVAGNDVHKINLPFFQWFDIYVAQNES